jgi:glutathione S-transferase
MKLYGFVLSPFTQRVLIAARIKGHELILEPPPGGTLQSSAFAAISPMCRIPLLEEDDGWRIAESTAIIAYLDDVLEGPPLLSADPRARALAQQMVAFADTELAPGLRHFMLQKVFRSRADAGQLAYGREQILIALDALAKAGIGTWEYAASGGPGVADAALIPNLVLIEILQASFDAGDLMGQRPGLDAYWKRARVSSIGQRTMEEMRAIVPIIMERRAKAAQPA